MDFFSAKRSRPSKSDAAVTSKVPQKAVPWVEKFRPRCINDIAHQEEVVSVLRNTVKGNEFPNLLFYGPPGTGKTSTILAVCRELYGNDIYRNRVLELNASDERGIQVVRDKVKKFANLSISAKKADGSPCPPFKVVILDEADSMTIHAQAALRRTMEKQSKTTRFCLICNYVTRIIEPITSRCAKFRFKDLPIETLQTRLDMICKSEDILIDEHALKQLILTSEGDLRKAITFLQSVHRLKAGEQISSDDVIEMAGIVPDELLDSLMHTCNLGSYEKLDANVKSIIMKGYSGAQILTQLHDQLVLNENMDDNQKSVVMEKLAVTDKCLCDGADEYLQLIALCTVIMDQLCRH